MKLLTFAPLLLAAGCAAVGPDFTPPEVALPAAFVNGQPVEAGDIILNEWWLAYDDAMLTELVEQGLAQNLDVQAATERIRQAMATLGTTGLNAALDGGVSASLTRSRTEGIGITGAFTPGLSGSFVIDLFGGIRRGQESAEASLAAAQADLGTVRLAWLGQVVQTYSDARFYQEALALTRQTVATRQRTVDITRREFEVGSATSYGVSEAQALLDIARADIPQYHASFNASVFALATLLNVPAAPLLERMQAGAPQLDTPSADVTGVPADLLRNRPDLRYYEAQLHAAVANVGVAEAQLYPSLTLLGDIAISAGVNNWSFGPSLSLPILNRGALAAERDVQVSLAEQAEIAWRQAVIGAVQDVQVAQSNVQQFKRRAATLRQAAASYAEALRLAQQSYMAGAINLIDLLDTDRLEAEARISAASAVNNSAKEWAALQLATGSGAWAGPIIEIRLDPETDMDELEDDVAMATE